MYASEHPALFRQFLQHLPLTVAMVDTQMQYLAVSRRWSEVYGFPGQSLIGEKLNPDWRGEFRVITPTGKISWVLVQEVPERNDSGEIIAYIGAITDITERKQTEAELAFLKTAVESASDAIGMANSDGYHIYQNPAFSQLYECATVEEFNQKGGIPARFVDPTLAAEVLSTIQKGKSWSGEVKQRTCEDRIVPIVLRADVIRDQQGNIIGLLGRMTDISHRKALEEKLAQQQTLLKSLIENSPLGIAIVDQEFCYLQINETLAQMNGVPAPDHIGKSIQEILPYLAPHLEPILQQVLATDTPVINLETKGYTPKDPQQERFWLTSYIPLHLDQQQQQTPVAVGLFVLEITEQKRLEAQQWATAQRLSLLVQQTPLAVIEWSTNFQVTAWNPAAEKIFGYSAQEAMGREGFGLTVPESAREIVSEGLNELLAQRGGYHGINENITKDGRIIICEWYNTPLVDDQGHLVGIASLALDITERVETQAALEKSQEMYRTLIENFPNGDVCLFDPENRYILAGGTELASPGMSHKFIEGKTIWDVFPYDFCQQLLPAYQAALNGTGKVCEISYGDQVYNTHTLPVKNEQGEVSA